MDFKGQELSEWYYQVIAVLFAVIAFAAGYFYESFYIAFQIWAIGVLVGCLVSVPDWPIYNRNPLRWVKSKST